MKVAIVVSLPKKLNPLAEPAPDPSKFVACFGTLIEAEFYCKLMNELDSTFFYTAFYEEVLNDVPPLLMATYMHQERKGT